MLICWKMYLMKQVARKMSIMVTFLCLIHTLGKCFSEDTYLVSLTLCTRVASLFSLLLLSPQHCHQVPILSLGENPAITRDLA